MELTIIKKGTNGDTFAPPIIDDRILTETVARARAEAVLYADQKMFTVTVLYDAYQRFMFTETGGEYFQIEEVDLSSLPYAKLTVRRLEDD